MREFVASKRKPKEYKRLDPDEVAKALGAKRITEPEEIKRFEKKYGISLDLVDKAKETCSNCKHWDTTGFGLSNSAQVGKCVLVARHWFPESVDKPISLEGVEHTHWPVSELIAVITRREFGCNQFKPEEKQPT